MVALNRAYEVAQEWYSEQEPTPAEPPPAPRRRARPRKEAAPEIWVTHDRASHWARLSSLSITIPDIQGCWITTDALNPAVALAVVVSAPAFGGLRLDQATTYATADGGATWRQLSDPHSFETKWMATWQNTIYANRCCITSETPAFGLVVSSDGMRTWQPIDQRITRAGEHVGEFWVRPDTGELLAAAWNPTTDVHHLWLTRDGGAHWSQLTTPPAKLGITSHTRAAPCRSDCFARVLCGLDSGESERRRKPIRGRPHARGRSSGARQLVRRDHAVSVDRY